MPMKKKKEEINLNKLVDFQSSKFLCGLPEEMCFIIALELFTAQMAAVFTSAGLLLTYQSYSLLHIQPMVSSSNLN